MALPEFLKQEIREYLSGLGEEVSDADIEETAAAMLSFALNIGGEAR